jgi:hypothetical protein
LEQKPHGGVMGRVDISAASDGTQGLQDVSTRLTYRSNVNR